MLSEKIGSAYEAVEKKRRRDGLRRLIEAGVITAGLQATKPLPHAAVERLCENHIRIATRETLRNSDQISVDTYGEPDVSTFETPETPSRIPKTLESTLGTIEWDRPFVAVVPNGKLIGYTGLGYSDADGVILETAIAQRRILERDLRKHPLSVARILAHENGFGTGPDPEPDYEEVCPLVNLYSNYYHWVQNTLTRLEGVRRYEARTGRKPKLLIRNDPPSWVLESLEVMGFDDDRVVEWGRKRGTAERLVVPSLRRLEFQYPARAHSHVGTGYRSLAAPPNACEWLRDVATENVATERFETGSTDRVYISRADAHRRRVRNEDEVMDLLEEYGFERYVLSDLSFPEQVALFDSADAIVAPHGAGLVNMIFASDCRVVELAPDPLRPTFFMLAETMGFDYSFLHCESDGRDITVDTAELEGLFSETA